MKFKWVVLIGLSSLVGVSREDGPSESIEWDLRGYIIYCPCMGRFGNQAEHFLGALGFAKSIDRTLVLPPWRTYKNIPFDEWFRVSQLLAYHRVILAEEFMSQLAPDHWPPTDRLGWCYSQGNDKSLCDMKKGVPFKPFWDELRVEFVDYVFYDFSYDVQYSDTWKTRFPPERYPVLAFKGAPARFPVKESHVHIHQYLHWSDDIEQQAGEIIQTQFNREPFVGIHLRNGIDWVNACSHVEGSAQFMASAQCLGYGPNTKVTHELCLPTTQEILRLTRSVVLSTGVKYVYVATDKTPLIKQLEEHLKDQKVAVFHLDPWLPQLDLAILGKSTHFIGNCVSSFTSFVARERFYKNKPTSYWGFS